MNLRELAELDLGAILEDGAFGFGWSVTLTNPDGATADFTGFSNDISQVIDPDTGLLVSGRLASVALRISSIYAADFLMPRGIADENIKPWIVEFNDINGRAYKFKIRTSSPDRALGLLVCTLEAYHG